MKQVIAMHQREGRKYKPRRVIIKVEYLVAFAKDTRLVGIIIVKLDTNHRPKNYQVILWSIQGFFYEG